MKNTILIFFLFFFHLSFGQSCQSGNCENGFGVYSFSNGDVYRGNWISGKRSGYGEHYYNNGDVYKGDFENSLFSGKGTYYFANGDIDISNYIEGKSTSRISYTWGNQRPQGCISGNCQNGFGKKGYLNGIYEGNFSNGQWKGRGKMTYPNGSVYEGEYNGFNREGYGVYIWASGKKYEGNWVSDNIEGEGTFYYLDGSHYTGNFSNYVRTGYGVYYYLDGSIYSGNWKEGLRHGNGKQEYTNGKIEEGTFENGKFLGTPTQSTISANTSQNPQESNIQFIQEKLVEFSALLSLAEKNLQNINDDSFDNQTNQANEILVRLSDFNKKNQIPKEKGEFLVNEGYKSIIDLMKRRQEYLGKVKVELEKIKKQQELNQNTQVNQSTKPIQNLTSTNKRNCSYCGGTGECRGCAHTIDKPYLDECSTKSRKEMRFGYVLCKQCFGYGYKREIASKCDCKNGVGQCPGEKCYISSCTDGWVYCTECNQSSKGENIGKCSHCKGSGQEKN
jgi:hypothetical protein